MPDYGFDHVHLLSPDPVKTAQFYEEMFGAKRVIVRELEGGHASVELNLNGTKLLVLSQEGARPLDKMNGYGLDHFGIITDDLEVAVAELKAKGVKFQQEITKIRPGVKISFLWAPENVLIELAERSG